MPSHASRSDASAQTEPEPPFDSAPARIAAISLFITACLLALKLTLGLISHSIAVLSDAVDSATDLVGGLAALLSVQYARRPADETHPYGHGKLEAVSASVAATVIGLGGGLVTFQAVRRLIEGSPHIDAGVGVIAMVIAAAANVAVSVFMQREARKSASMALAAEATHLRTNIVQAGTIIAGLVLVAATDRAVFDPLTALLLAAYMAWTALRLVRTALSEIVDESLPPGDLDIIRDVLRGHEGEIRGYHQLRTRRSGRTREIDMHLLFAAERSVAEVHETADHVSDDIRRRLPGSVVVIHVEPEGEPGRGERA